MDRFIVQIKSPLFLLIIHLKSNMDRFIGGADLSSTTDLTDLKSNMDRFIDADLSCVR